MPPQHADAFALLAVIGDPAAAKKRLEELVAAQQAIAQAHAEARDAAKQAASDRAENEKLLSALAIAKRDNEAKLKVIGDARLDQREAALKARESKVAEAEANAAAALAEGTALKTKWHQRVQKLKAAQADVD